MGYVPNNGISPTAGEKGILENRSQNKSEHKNKCIDMAMQSARLSRLNNLIPLSFSSLDCFTKATFPHLAEYTPCDPLLVQIKRNPNPIHRIWLNRCFEKSSHALFLISLYPISLTQKIIVFFAIYLFFEGENTKAIFSEEATEAVPPQNIGWEKLLHYSIKKLNKANITKYNIKHVHKSLHFPKKTVQQTLAGKL